MASTSNVPVSVNRNRKPRNAHHTISDSDEGEEKEEIEEEVQKDSDSECGYECKYCGQEFETEKQLDAHEQTHEGAIPSTSTGNAPKHQLGNMSADRKDALNSQFMECEVCGQVLQAHYLAEHLRTHTGEEPLTCRCGRKFTWKSAYISHTKKCALS